MRLLVLWLALLSPCVWADSKTPLQIRRGADRDIAEILTIDRANGGNLTEKKLRDEIQPRNANYTVVVDDHRVVGFMVYEIGEKAIDLKRIGVASFAEDKGVADALAQSLLTRVSSDGLTVVRAELAAPESALIEAFSRSQFEVVAEANGRVKLEGAPTSRLLVDAALPGFQTYYELLGVAQSAHPDEIRRAFDRRSAANESNPDVLAQLSQARAVLLSTESRAAYDRIHVPHLDRDTPSLYHRLGVLPDATPEAIASAYQRAVRKLCAGSLSGSRTAARMQNLLDEAFAVLGRPSLRDQYNRLVHSGGPAAAVKAFLKNAPRELPSLEESLGFNSEGNSAYELLGVASSATLPEIGDKYAGLKSRHGNLDAKFPEVGGACRILSSDLLRAYYDAHYPALDSQGRRVLLHEMSLYEEKYLEWAELERRNAEDGLVRPSHFALEGDRIREPAADPKENRSEPLLYRMLGVTRTASAQDIERGYAMMKKTTRGNPQERAEGENAYLVLSNPQYKRQYDRTLSDSDTIEITKDREAAYTIMALARVSEVVARPGPGGVDEFVGATFTALNQIGESAGLAKNYLRALLAAVDRTRGPLKESTFRMGIAASNAVGQQFAGPDWKEIRELEQQIRSRLVDRAISDTSDSAARDRFLEVYLANRPPDYLSDRLREARDTNEIHEVRDAGTSIAGQSRPFCDWARIGKAFRGVFRASTPAPAPKSNDIRRAPSAVLSP